MCKCACTQMCVNVCMIVYTYMRIYVDIHIRIYVCIHIYTYIHICGCMHRHIPIFLTSARCGCLHASPRRFLCRHLLGGFPLQQRWLVPCKMLKMIDSHLHMVKTRVICYIAMENKYVYWTNPLFLW